MTVAWENDSSRFERKTCAHTACEQAFIAHKLQHTRLTQARATSPACDHNNVTKKGNSSSERSAACTVASQPPDFSASDTRDLMPKHRMTLMTRPHVRHRVLDASRRQLETLSMQPGSSHMRLQQPAVHCRCARLPQRCDSAGRLRAEHVVFTLEGVTMHILQALAHTLDVVVASFKTV